MVRLILDSDPRPVLVHGGPGIGKSALTIAALHHPEVAARFADRRWFVELDAVTLGEAVLDAVGSALGEPAGPDRPARALIALAAAPGLLVLDNLETPWEAPKQGADTAKALRQLEGVPGLRLVASIRGSERPLGARWRVLHELETLALADARALFLDVAGEIYAEDPDLDALLGALGGLPLALDLMARRVEEAGSAGRLLALWRTLRTRLAAVGTADDRELSLHASIETSLTSPRLDGAGRRLFAALGRLPDGLAEDDAEALFPGEGFAAAAGLRRVGLARRESGRLRMLVPVRHHAEGKPFSGMDGHRLVALFLGHAERLSYVGESAQNMPAVLRARAELANIEAMLTLAENLVIGSDVPPVAWWELAICALRVGDARYLLGNLAAAAAAYSTTQRLLSRPAISGLDDDSWQRDLLMSWVKLGNVRRKQGNLTGALAAYKSAKTIAERLAAADPGNTEWQLGLAVSWERLGNIRVAQGDVAGALAAYSDAKAAAERLVAADPGNTEWQRDLSVRWNKLGNAWEMQGSLTEALHAYEAGKSIIEGLLSLEPENVGWRRDLGASWERLSNTLREQGDFGNALHACHKSREQIEFLIRIDHDNAEWQRDLAISWSRLGQIHEQQARIDDALQAYAAGNSIHKYLVSLEKRKCPMAT